jgi:hypothetical protein
MRGGRGEIKMGEPRIAAEVEEPLCPACGASVRMASVARGLHVECPACTKVVAVAESFAAETVGVREAAREVSRLAALEERLASVERALAAGRPVAGPAQGPKFQWMTDKAGEHYSAAQAELLRHNLSLIAPHPVIIQSPIGDDAARERAEWFRTIFALAQWPVRGPEDAPTDAPRGALVLATQLPVPPQVAVTYLAIRAAGFELETIFDADSPATLERLIVS